MGLIDYVLCTEQYGLPDSMQTSENVNRCVSLSIRYLPLVDILLELYPSDNNDSDLLVPTTVSL
jgi:hypothetical protein